MHIEETEEPGRKDCPQFGGGKRFGGPGSHGNIGYGRCHRRGINCRHLNSKLWGYAQSLVVYNRLPFRLDTFIFISIYLYLKIFFGIKISCPNLSKI